MLEVVVLVDSRGVKFVALQFRGSTPKWWWSYLHSKLAWSPPVEWEVFSKTFQERFIPWSVRDER